MSNSTQERTTTDHQSIVQQLPSDNLLQLVFSLPPQLLSFLVICSKPIYLISQLSLVVQWSHPLGPYPSWILLFIYIALVLSSPFLLCFAIPNVLLLAILSINLVRKKSQQPQIQNKISSSNSSHPIAVLDSLQSFQILVQHYSVLASNLNPIYQLITCSDQERSTQAIKICLTSIPFSILVTYLIPPRSIILILGSILIVWSSKWFQLLIRLLWKSLLLRLFVFLLVDLCLCAHFHPISRLHQLDPSLQNIQPTHSFYSTLSYLRTLFKFYSPNLFPPQKTDSNRKSEDSSYSLADPSQDIEFCLTIFENQRWWMGLDWTSNLLPHERPNWADSINHPVPTPANIILPSSKSFKDVNQNLQRKVEWKWIDSDWKIIEAHTSTNQSKEEDNLNQDDERLKCSSPVITHPVADKPAGSTLNHTPPSSPNASFRRHQNRSSASHSGSSACLSACLDSEIIDESLRNSGLSASIVGAHDPTKPWDVDANGWQYGDNHWEKMSSKSGIGKYTRRRAWARKACLVTRLEPLQGSSSTSSREMDSLVGYSPSIISSPADLGSASDSATAVLHNISVKSSALVYGSSSSTSSSVSLIKDKKSFSLLKRKK